MTIELREEKIARLEASGDLDPNCITCQKYFYTDPNVDPFAPRHKASSLCESGHRPHCTCDTCF